MSQSILDIQPQMHTFGIVNTQHVEEERLSQHRKLLESSEASGMMNTGDILETPSFKFLKTVRS